MTSPLGSDPTTAATAATDTTARRVLCAVDFSASSRGALARAIAAAKAEGSVLTLIHVVSAPFAMGLSDDAPRFFSAASEASVATLAEWKNHAIAAGVPAVETVHVAGVPWERIVGRALAHQDDLIVIGTRGRGGLARALLGSVAERVLRHAPCSVLVTRAEPSSPLETSKGPT